MEYELWVSVHANEDAELVGTLTANKYEYDPTEIEHGEVVNGRNDVADLLRWADSAFRAQAGYTLKPDGWAWSQDHGAFRRMATMGDPETPREITLNGNQYRLVEE